MTKEEIINEIKPILSELSYPDAVSYLTQNDVKWLNEIIKILDNPIAIVKIKYDKDKLKELVDKAVFTVIPQELKSEWERDHEILKAYSDGANEILDKIRAEIEQERSFQRAIDEYDIATGLRKALEIIDKYKAESEG